MSDYDKLVKLLGQTDGRDKIYKFLGGVFKIISHFDAGSPRAAAYKSLGNSITDGRSLMRMAKWSGDIPKMQKIIINFYFQNEKGKGIDTKKIIEFFRILGNFLYILGDNVAFLAKRKLLPGDSKKIQFQSKVAQFWGFFLAAVLDIIALRAALSLLKNKNNSSNNNNNNNDDIDAVVKKETKAALISFTKDAADVLVTMAAVGYFKEIWNPTAPTAGALTALSGAVATYLNWKKIK